MKVSNGIIKDQAHHQNPLHFKPKPRKRSRGRNDVDIFTRRNTFYINYIDEEPSNTNDNIVLSGNEDITVIEIDDDETKEPSFIIVDEPLTPGKQIEIFNSASDNDSMESLFKDRIITISVYPPLVCIKTHSRLEFSLKSNKSFQDVFFAAMDTYNAIVPVAFMYEMVRISEWATPSSLLVKDSEMTIYMVLENDIPKLSLEKYENWCDYVQRLDIAIQSKKLLKSQYQNTSLINDTPAARSLNTIELNIRGPKGFQLAVPGLDPSSFTIKDLEKVVLGKVDTDSVDSKNVSFRFDGNILSRSKTLESLMLEDGDCVEIHWKP